MKLLIYSHFFAPSVGGVETIVLGLARGLAGLRESNGTPKFEITLVTETPRGTFNDSDLPFRVLRRPGMIRLWRNIRSTEVVHVAGPALPPIFLAWLLRKPLVVEHHGFQTICPNGQLFLEPRGSPCPGHFMANRHMECLRCNSANGWFLSYKLWLLTSVRRFLCAQAAANIAPTQWLAGLLGLPQTTFIPHGLELVQIVPRQELPSGTPVIAFLGRLVTTKGARILLEAARIMRTQNPRFQLLIIGDGPERAALEQCARDSHLDAQVRFAGRIENNQLEVELTKAYALAVPSLGGEVFGLVLAENMARSLPIVASDLGAFREVLGDAGLLFRTGDASDLARVLLRVLGDPAWAATLGQRARQRARDVSDPSRMIDMHAAIYSR